MAFIIKPLVTEKMTKLTDKSSADKKFVARSQKTIEKYNAQEEKRSYSFMKNGKEVNKEKTIHTYAKPVCVKYCFIVKPEANKLEIKKEIESLYNVTVLDVNTVRYAGKRQSR